MTTLFFSYSHKDEELRNELETHLALLARQGVITAWHDRRITAGSDLHKSVSSRLESAQIVLLLVSSYFLASDYCYEREMKRALEKHKEGTATVIPVILHPCDWHSAPFGNLRATPTDGKPISMHANQHEAFAIVAKDVRRVAESFQGTNSGTWKEEESALDHSTRSPSRDRSSNLRIKRKFDDHERDTFLEGSYEYIADYFEASLQELSARNPHITTRFKRLSATRFSASIYDDGERVAQCSIWCGSDTLSSPGIFYSQSREAQRSSFNESFHVVDNGYTLQLQPLGLNIFNPRRQDALSQQGAAEYYWEMLVSPLQD